MATASSSTTSTDPKLDLIKQIRTHEVAIAELGNLSSSRTVYQKNGYLFFRTTIQKATSSEEKQLDMEKAKFEKLNSRTKGQQAYLNNYRLEGADKSKDNNAISGVKKKSCKSYIPFRAEPPCTSAVTIAYLLGAQPDLISSLRLNNLSSDVSSVPANSRVFVPLNCFGAGSYYQHNVTYTIKDDAEAYFILANDTYQGLTTCQAMKAQNSIAGAKFLFIYIADWEESIASIAETFGVDEQSVLDANKLREDMIYHYTPVLVPLAIEPTMILPPQASPSPPSPSQIATAPIRKSKSSYKGRYTVESLAPYNSKDLEAATGNAGVKVMKGDVSAEMNLLMKINHNKIVRLSGFCVHEGNTYLVYEDVEKGSLDDLLQSSKCKLHLLFRERGVQIAYYVANALNYLHNYVNPPYMHKNLKSSNILLDGNFRAKVANFGLSRTVENGGALQLTKHVVGTQGWLQSTLRMG
ncbi:hypothetical protein CRYUN_Cryun08bG0053200 [Craigia yunnanensis]